MKSSFSVRQLIAAAGTWVSTCVGAAANPSTSTFSSLSTPAREVYGLSLFVLAITGMIFFSVSCLLVYALVHFRARPDDEAEPPQVFGSVNIELAWTIIPILTLVVLFLGTARVLFSIQDARKPASALDVTVVGHQFWWEFRYPQYNVVTANELHLPLSSAEAQQPTFMKLTSADVMHSFWVPQLAGKTDLLPNRVNEMWIDPLKPGLYLGQCAQFCGIEHAKMLLRIYVDEPEQFRNWIAEQQQKQPEIKDQQAADEGQPNPKIDERQSPLPPNSPATRINTANESAVVPQGTNAHDGQLVFEHQACINCHTVAGTIADGRFGPDLTHLMSRSTLAAGVVSNTPDQLNAWISAPDKIKPGSLMPNMHLTDRQNAQITAYLLTLK